MFTPRDHSFVIIAASSFHLPLFMPVLMFNTRVTATTTAAVADDVSTPGNRIHSICEEGCNR